MNSSSAAGGESATEVTPTGLLSLPPVLLQRILSLVLADEPRLSLACLSSLGSHIAQHGGFPLLLDTLTLVDDDALLVDCEQPSPTAPTAPTAPLQQTHALQLIWHSHDKALLVNKLIIITPPPLLSTSTSTPQDQDAALSRQPVPVPLNFNHDDNDSELYPPPLEDTSFLLLLTKLSSLRSFHWHTNRLPPIHLCPALGAACKGLVHFRFELAEGATTGAGAGEVGSPRIGAGAGAGGAGPEKLRWDAPDLSALPLTLTTLSLSNLSQPGTRSLTSALPSLPNLEDLELARTVFIDDEVMSEIGASARKLRKLKVREMSGTKLSEVGLGEVLEGCTELEVLVLDAVEGRLSKSCWTKLTPLPSQLHTLALYYTEPSPHKSWTLDHLLSLPSALPTSSLHTLIISRKPDPGALIPGRHHHSRFPVDQVMVPKPLGEEMVEALLERGEEWRNLELDMWKVGAEELKKIMEGCSGLVRLKVLFDAPFRTLLTLSPSFALSQNLRHFLLSIDPSHTPELNTMNFLVTPPKHSHSKMPSSSSTSLPATPAASPGSPRSPLPTIPSDAPAPASPPSPSTSFRSPLLGGRRGSLSTLLSPSSSSTETLSTASYATRTPINTREWRRFLKKTHRLEDIDWYGRGGMGRWRFERGHAHLGGGTAGVGKVEVELEPIVWSEGGGVGAGAGGGGEVGAGSVVWRCENRRRRSSSVSLAGSCLSGLALSPSPEGSPSLSHSQQDDYSPKTARSSTSTSTSAQGSRSSGFNGLGLTGLSPAVTTPATSFATSTPPSSTSPTAPYSSAIGAIGSKSSASPSSPTQSRPPLKPSTSPSTVPTIYPGGWHSGSKSAGASSFGAIGGGAGGRVNLDKEKERHLEREREKERQRVKERQAEAEGQFPPLAGGGPTTTTTTTSSRSNSGKSSKASSPVLSTSGLPPPRSSAGGGGAGGKGRGGGGKSARGGGAGGAGDKGERTERVIPGLPSSMQNQGQGGKKGGGGGGRGRK